MEQKPVLFAERSFASTTLGVIELNSSRTLNALSLEIIDLIIERLETWKFQANIHGVVITSNSSKAFCAGGDIKSLAVHLRSGAKAQELSVYFEKEYYLDAYVSQYPKVTIGIAEGYILGGGWGLFNACDIKLVSETAQFGMPEISIGFFPDVGAGYFLKVLPLGLRKYICLTKAFLDAAEALHYGFASAVFSSDQRRRLEPELLKLSWSSDQKQNKKMIERWVKTWKSKVARTSELSKNEKKLAKVYANKNFNQLLKDVEIKGSPVTAQVIHELIHRGPKKNLIDQLIWDWSIAYQMLESPEFSEGVRAVLIDKDQNPTWTYRMGEVPLNLIQAILEPISPNPLEARIHSTFNKRSGKKE